MNQSTEALAARLFAVGDALFALLCLRFTVGIPFASGHCTVGTNACNDTLLAAALLSVVGHVVLLAISFASLRAATLRTILLVLAARVVLFSGVAVTVTRVSDLPLV